MKICVDTDVLIDVLKDQYPPTQEAFYKAIEARDSLMASVITAAELLPQFGGSKTELSRFLSDHGIEVRELDLESTLLAAERWMKYLKKRKSKRCPSCDAPIPGRDAVLADFLIGGFALTHCDRILTRDRGIYRAYFSDLEML